MMAAEASATSEKAASSATTTPAAPFTCARTLERVISRRLASPALVARAWARVTSSRFLSRTQSSSSVANGGPRAPKRRRSPGAEA
jgi:hypothetical protein